MDVSAGDTSSGQTLIFTLLGGALIYLFGYLRAVMHRANTDYKATKAAVKPLRKAYWLSVWSATKIGFWVIAGFALLIMWTVREMRN